MISMDLKMRDLYIYGSPDMERLKSAKASLGLPYLVQPIRVSGSTTFARFLAWGDKPPGLGDYAYVTDETSPDGLTAALRWVLTDEDNPRATTILSTLTNIFGFGVREVDKAQLNQENRTNALQTVSFKLKLQEKGDSHEW